MQNVSILFLDIDDFQFIVAATYGTLIRFLTAGLGVEVGPVEHQNNRGGGGRGGNGIYDLTIHQYGGQLCFDAGEEAILTRNTVKEFSAPLLP